MTMNKITLSGRIVRCGRTPIIIRECGFKSPDEVHDAATKYGVRVSGMRTDDVADWFDEQYGRVE